MSNILRVLGCDPGITGAICVYSQHSLVPIAPDGIIDFPTYIEGDHTKLVDGWKLKDWLLEHRPHIGFIEQVFPMPSVPDKKTGERRSMGSTSAFNFGRNYQTARDVIIHGCDVPLYTVGSKEWQGMWELRGQDKEASRQCALRHFPSAAPFLARKGDHNRAESLLIAAYGSVRVNRSPDDYDNREWTE